MWMPDSWRATEGGFWAYWNLECTSAFYCCTINTVMDLLPTFLLILIDDFIKMYAETLKKLDWKEMNKEKIREVCETHREIKEICIEFEGIYAKIYFLQGFISTALLCTIGFALFGTVS
jgi:hypothetical protein